MSGRGCNHMLEKSAHAELAECAIHHAGTKGDALGALQRGVTVDDRPTEAMDSVPVSAVHPAMAAAIARTPTTVASLVLMVCPCMAPDISSPCQVNIVSRKKM